MPLRRDGKPFYIKLHKLAPRTNDANLLVRIESLTCLVDKLSKDGKPIRHYHVRVADDTGVFIVNAHDHHVSSFEQALGQVRALHHVHVRLVQSKMFIALDRWTSIDTTTRTIPRRIAQEPDFSAVSYQTLTSSEQ